jgi:hypothetical protein
MEMKIILTYCGKRRSAKGTMFHKFIDDKGEEHNFGGSFKNIWIGSFYEAEKTKGSIQMSSRPAEIERDPVDEALLRKWKAEQALAEQEAREHRVRKKAESMKELLEEIPKIKRFIRDLKSDEQRYFMDWLWHEVDRENREKLNREFNALVEKRLKRAVKVGSKK